MKQTRASISQPPFSLNKTSTKRFQQDRKWESNGRPKSLARVQVTLVHKRIGKKKRRAPSTTPTSVGMRSMWLLWHNSIFLFSNKKNWAGLIATGRMDGKRKAEAFLFIHLERIRQSQSRGQHTQVWKAKKNCDWKCGMYLTAKREVNTGARKGGRSESICRGTIKTIVWQWVKLTVVCCAN